MLGLIYAWVSILSELLVSPLERSRRSQMVFIPAEWQIDGLSHTREALNAISPKDTPAQASLVAGPSLSDLILANDKAAALLSATRAHSICSLPAHEIVDAIKNKVCASETLP